MRVVCHPPVRPHGRLAAEQSCSPHPFHSPGAGPVLERSVLPAVLCRGQCMRAWDTGFPDEGGLLGLFPQASQCEGGGSVTSRTCCSQVDRSHFCNRTKLRIPSGFRNQTASLDLEEAAGGRSKAWQVQWRKDPGARQASSAGRTQSSPACHIPRMPIP